MSAAHDPAADRPLGDHVGWCVWHFLAGWFWITFGACLIIFASVLPEEGEPLTAVGLLLLALALVCVFIGARRLRAVFFLEVTRAQIKEHDLWRGERLLLVGALLLSLPAILADELLGIADIAGADAFVVMIALMVIGPVSFWVGPNWGALSEIRRAKKEAKARESVALVDSGRKQGGSSGDDEVQRVAAGEERGHGRPGTNDAPDKPGESGLTGAENAKPATPIEVAIAGWLVGTLVLRELRRPRGS